jgi:hypothetical protein
MCKWADKSQTLCSNPACLAKAKEEAADRLRLFPEAAAESRYLGRGGYSSDFGLLRLDENACRSGSSSIFFDEKLYAPVSR